MTARFVEDIVEAGIAGLAPLFAAGTVDPVAVAQLYLARIAAYDSRISAYVTVDAEGALAAAQESRVRWAAGAPLSPIDGVPIAVKANIAVAGLPWHAGIDAYRARIAEGDAACIARLRASGAVLLGLVNMHEAAAGATTDNPFFGRTYNPWRQGYTPAGSSGGSGAAVAAGLAAGALGTDTGGSVRMPSAFCGIYGLKPAHGVVSLDGVIPLSWTLDHVGVHARSAEDCALLLAAIARTAPITPGKIAEARPLRLARLDVEAFSPVEPLIAAALERTVARAEGLGAVVEAVTLPFALADLLPPVRDVIAAEAAIEHEARRASTPEGFSEALVQMLDRGDAISARTLGQMQYALIERSDQIRDVLAGYDALLMPTTGVRPHSFSEVYDSRMSAFAFLANISKLPAMAFPAGLDADGLPASVQALAWDEATALRVAALLAEDVGAPPDFAQKVRP